MNLRFVVSIAALMLPWHLRRLLLVHVLKYEIDKSARIGFSFICPTRLKMGPKSIIGHLTQCKPGVDLLELGEGAQIGNLNWITGVSLKGAVHFQDSKDRRPELVVHDQAALTSRHYVDCTAAVSIGRFSTFAGCRSVVLTHSIDLIESKQRAASVSIGEYCFVGAATVLLPGSALPDYSVLGANSLLNKQYSEPYYLYAGSPARPVKALSRDMKYFTRTQGYVD
jgi:acetyltransferase-like isoleucine patch superfamily enzyme